jgi:hypothetical protein
LARSRSGGCSLGDLGVGGGEDAPAIPTTRNGESTSTTKTLEPSSGRGERRGRVKGRGSVVEKRGIRSVTASTYSRGEEEEVPKWFGYWWWWWVEQLN